VGAVRMLGARIRGELSCSGATLLNDDGDALSLDGAQIGGGVFLDVPEGGGHGFRATGEVRMLGVEITGALDCSGATLVNEKGDALSLDRAQIGASVFLNVPEGGGDGFRAAGAVRMLGARIAGDLSCRNATLANEDGVALWLDGAQIGGSVFLDAPEEGGDGFRATGEVRMPGAQIRGDLSCSGATLVNENGYALSLENTRVEGVFCFRPRRVSGSANFRQARVTTLDDTVGDGTAGTWESLTEFVLTEFVYDRFVQGWDVSDRRRWLERRWLEKRPKFEQSAWWQLASVYRAHGRDDDAVAALVAMQNDRLSQGDLSRPRWAGRWILRLTVGHGYRPWYALLWAVVVIAAFACVISLAPDRFVPTDAAVSGHPQPIIYAIDVFLPIVDFEQRDWTPTAWARGVAFAVVLLGWSLTTLFVAGFTRIVRT
jgi:hypothetical protein